MTTMALKVLFTILHPGPTNIEHVSQWHLCNKFTHIWKGGGGCIILYVRLHY